MNLDSILKMKELELESDEISNNDSQSDEDGDLCEPGEIDRLFVKSEVVTENPIALNKKYILHIAGTLESNPNVATALSDYTCEIFNFSNNQFAKLNVLSEHTDVISEVKFCRENNNLIYTGSNDGTVRLWDIRTPTKSTLQFKDTTVEDKKKMKEIGCFDVSSNGLLLAAGSNLYEGDAFILFWDVRKHSLLGGYWESHTDDITQVKFHSSDPNKLISGSVDGLINYYNLLQANEDDALIDSFNTESSVEKIEWLNSKGQDIISCITHTADVQFWKLDDAQPYKHLHRSDVAKEMKRKTEDYIYVVDVHGLNNHNFMILVGSNYCDGECLRGLSFQGNNLKPFLGFSDNKQRVRASWLNPNTNLLLTGGERGILNAWNIKVAVSAETMSPSKFYTSVLR